jgi:hypothetical protein
MVLLSIERFVSIMFPLKKNLFSSRKNAKQALAILTCIILIWSLYKIATPGVERYSTFNKVHSPDNCREMTMPQIVNVSTLMWAVFPEIFTLLLNLLIIQRIKITTNPQKKFYPSERTKKITQATRVVLILSIMFIVLNSPTGLLIIIDVFFFANRDASTIDKFLKQVLNMMTLRKIVLMVYETNFIINFPIYFFTIKNFK